MKKCLSPVLLTPGPVPLYPGALKALSEPAIHHRSSEFSSLFLKLQVLLQQIFQTRQIVLVLNASGTGAMSAALLNTLSPGDQVLAVCAGKFGDRWADMATAYHLQVIKLKVPWGEAADPGAVRRALEKHPDIKAILIQACETSTGVLHPVKAIAGLVKKRPHTLCLVDAISAVGAMSIPMDKWHIDALIGGSQKSMALPAGMSFVALSDKAWKFNACSKLPVYYFDLKKEKTAQLKGYTAFSSNVAYIRALYISLKHDEDENMVPGSQKQRGC